MERAVSTIETRISGIPCVINVLRIDAQPADHRALYSDWDFNGWTDIEWEVCDQSGRPAPWLSKKLTGDDSVRIEAQIMKECRA
jgi:hypothetical protein